MKAPYLVLVGGVVALVLAGLMTYAGFLTSEWGTLLACTPAVLVTIGVVGGMLSGMFFFEVEEEETPAEASRLDGAALFDWIGVRAADLVHRTAIRLHVRGLSR